MIGFKNVIRSHKSAVALLSVVFLCVIGGIVYTISKPVPIQLDQSSSSSAPVSSSVKVKVADISPANSTTASAVSSKADPQKVGVGQSVSEGEANYKPANEQPQNQTNSKTDDVPSNGTANNPIIGIEVPDHISLKVGDSLPISIEITPETAPDKKVIWKSSDENIATVDKTGMVKGMEAGSCTVTVQAAAGKTQASIIVTVALQKEANEGS